MKVKIIKNGINGEGIGYLNKKPVFIAGALKNEVVDIEIVEEKDKYCIGRMRHLIKASGNRVEAPCFFAEKCGGCPLIHSNYSNQLLIKQENLKETLIKYAGYNGPIEKIVPSDKDLFYRNKCNLPFVDHEGDIANGLYQTGTNIPVSIDKCILHATKLEKVRCDLLKVLNNHSATIYDSKSKKGYRQVMIRGFKNSYQIVLITGEMPINQKIVDDIMAIENVSSLYQGINTIKNPIKLMPEEIKLIAGSDSIPFELGKYKLQLQPQAFFQLNQFTANKLYSKLNEIIDTKVHLLVEAYCGIGAISMYLHDKADSIIAIDIEKSAIKDGKFNAKLNNIKNVDFRLGDASSQITSIMTKETIDVLVVDPPRKGIDEKLLESIKENRVKEIVYISCNPATLAKNIKTLSESYEVARVIPFDMFPQTPLVETIAVLKLKD